MELTKSIPGVDAKLDGMLSLLMKESEESNYSLAHFFATCSDLFGDESTALQEILCEDGLVTCFVGPCGLGMEITEQGIRFMSNGGYSHEIREELVLHRREVRNMVNIRFWNTVVVVLFVAAVAICFFLSRRAG